MSFPIAKKLVGKEKQQYVYSETCGRKKCVFKSLSLQWFLNFIDTVTEINYLKSRVDTVSFMGNGGEEAQ